MRFYRILALGALVLTGLGCENDPATTLEGRVVSEFGTAHEIVESGTESSAGERLDYGIVLQSDDGREYTLGINNSSSKPNLLLARAINKGSKVRITYDYTTQISDDGIGTTGGDNVSVVKAEE